MKTKAEVPDKVRQYLNTTVPKGEYIPRALQADNRCEYVNNDLTMWCHAQGIEL